MRALSGAIITAAALIGLGLTAQGIGTRYANFLIYKAAPAVEGAPTSNVKTVPDYDNSFIRIRDLDNPMKLCLTILVLAVLVGLAITFIGLALHHHRRYHEHMRLYGQPAETPSSRVPM